MCQRDDTISRQAAIDVIKKCRNESDMPDMWYDGMSCALRCIYQLPSAQSEITGEQAIEHLRESGWMQNHDKQMYEMGLREQLADDSDSYNALLPSAQPQSEDPDWSYNDDTAEIILVVPKDVYESTKTVFLSAGDEGKPYLRGKIYSAQPQRMRGKWLDNETSFADGVRQTCTCSICGRRSTRPIGDFCRWCGADMRGEQDG